MEYYNKTQTDFRISQCCQFHDTKLAKRYNFGTTTKTYALKADGKAKVQAKAIENCRKLLDIVSTYFPTQPRNLRSFRISSELFPCYTLDFTRDWYVEIWPVLCNILERAGAVAKQHEIRLSVHPAQFTVLGSNNADVVKKSIEDLEYHALYGQLMNIPAREFVMNIHLQGLYGGKHEDGIKRFATNFQYLSDYAQQCLAVENEDKPQAYDITHVVELCNRIPTRATLDTHHFACHRMTQTEIVKQGDKKVNRKVRDVKHITHTSDMFTEAVKSWKDIRPLFHVSQSFHPDNQDYWMKPQAHSDVLWDEELMAIHVPMLQYADFDIEAKHKEVAVQQFYNFIKQEEYFAGELVTTRTL
jgi:UV DNA damage repair endonuclease